MEVESGGVPKAVEAEMQAKFEELQSGRKARTTPDTLASVEDLSSYEVTSTHPLHSTTKAGIKCLAVGTGGTIVTGGVDGSVIVFDKESGKISKTFKAHTKAVLAVDTDAGAIISSSVDKAVKIYAGNAEDGFDKGVAVKPHTGEVTGVSLHPTGKYFATSSLDGSWSFTQSDGSVLLTVSDPGGKGGYTAVQFHPDGLLAGLGTSDGSIQIFDVRKQAAVATLPGHKSAVTTIAFSENGYYLASGSADGTCCCWDLRKLKKNHGLVSTIQAGAAVSSVAFDYSGSYLAVGADDVKVYKAKKWDLLATYGGHKSAVTAVAFGPDAQWICSASADRNLRFFGKA